MPSGSEKKNYSVLIIEDNPGDFHLIREYLSEQGLSENLSHAFKFSVAEKLLNGGKHSFDAILLDLTLPDLSGEELINRVTGLEGNAVTIVLTGHSDMEFGVRSLSMGISDYLLKDELTPNGLFKSIRYSLERRDASENLKKSEERYRALFHNNPNPLMIIDSGSGKILDINREAIVKYGYDASRFKELNLQDIQIGSAGGEANLKSLQNGRSEVRLHKTKNGEIFFAEVNAHPINLDGSKSFIAIISDVSDKLEMQERMVESAVRAEEEERNRIAKDLHDGIVQQLVACGMFIQNLQDKTDDKEKLQEEIDRLSALIRDITNETRDLSHNLKSAEFEITSLADLTGQLVRQLSFDSEVAFIFKNYLSYEDNFDAEFKKHVFRILQELCNNVIKHSKAEKAVISMEVINGILFITIKDNGVGLQSDKAQKHGIGLRNIKSRVYRLGGELDMENQKEGGLQVHIELPVIEQ